MHKINPVKMNKSDAPSDIREQFPQHNIHEFIATQNVIKLQNLVAVRILKYTKNSEKNIISHSFLRATSTSE